MDIYGWLLLLCTSFLASMVGTMIGLAMPLVLPIMVFLGIPIHTAIATARFSMVGITAGNIWKFYKFGGMEKKYVMPIAIAGVMGSFTGSFFITHIGEQALRTMIGILMIFISSLVLLEDYIKIKRHQGNIKWRNFLAIVIGFVIGVNLGIIGGGGATIVVFSLLLLYGLDFHKALANQKAILLPISLTATIVFIFKGLIDYSMAIPMFIVNFTGGWIGASLITKINPRWLKMVVVPIAVTFAIRLIFY